MASLHVELYDDFFGIDVHNTLRCELTGWGRQTIRMRDGKYVRVWPERHHIKARGMGGRPSAERVENIMALTVEAHRYFGDKTKYSDWLKENHLTYMDVRVPLWERDPDDPILLKFLLKSFKILY